MSYEVNSTVAIDVHDVSKCYHVYAQPADRLKQFVLPRLNRLLPSLGRSRYYREFWSLRSLSFSLVRGEVLGVVGTNGAGKSTLLQLISGVLQPTTGQVQVNGRVAALLELGAGFNPEFTGRENVYLNATLLGMHEHEIDEKFDEIVAFSGIAEFIDQPVKTYSSGMYVRLAFSIATSVDPDILIIDEALSVGDGAFARQSFDRIMDLKARGATILFCSHNVYQVEAMCQRVLWLDRGEVRALGQAAAVCQQYNQFLDGEDSAQVSAGVEKRDLISGVARLQEVKVGVEGSTQDELVLQSKLSTLVVDVSFASSLELPCPSLAVIITDAVGRNLSSCSNHYDGVEIQRDDNGLAQMRVRFPQIHLLRGRYVVNVFLLCEQAIHIYDSARCAEFEVTQPGLEVGVVALAHEWEQL
jgi:lipopolysaccharide transport system ATP-binding protein